MTPPIFHDWHQPLLPQAACDLVPDDAAGRALDLSGHIVVVPGGRARRRLEELLVERGQKLGVFLTPPQITTFGQLPELLFERDGAVASSQALTMAWAETLRTFPRDRLSTLYGHLPADGALAEWVRMARQLHALHREIAGGALLFDAVISEVSGAEAGRWRVLAELQNEVLARLNREGVVDPDHARITAMRAGELRSDTRVWLIGIPEVSGVARAFLEQIRDQLTVLTHAPEECRGLFDDLGALRVDAWLERELSLDDQALRVAEGPSEQARHVVEIIADAAEKNADLQPEDFVVGALDADVLPFLEEKLGEAGLTARDAAGRPITASAPLRLLASTAALLTGRRWEAFAAWVRHPDIDRYRRAVNPDADADAHAGAALSLSDLDRWYEQRLPVRVELHLTESDGSTSGDPTQESTIPERVAQLTSSLLGVLARDTTRQSISHWTEPILEYLARVYGDLDLDEGSVQDRSLITALSLIGA